MADMVYSKSSILRLSRYLKYIVQLKEIGQRTVTSREISTGTGVNSAEVRRDFIYFAIKGKRGVGFSIDDLIDSFNKILGYDRLVCIDLIGAGNLGKAILKYKMLERFGFKIKHVFDNDQDIIGKTISGHKILDINQLKDIYRDSPVEISILAVPPDSAQKVTDILVESGSRVIINYTSFPVKTPTDVRVETTDPIEKLLHTLYYLSHTGYGEFK